MNNEASQDTPALSTGFEKHSLLGKPHSHRINALKALRHGFCSNKEQRKTEASAPT